jgi:VanZ family protein
MWLRLIACTWVAGWAFFGLPWQGFTREPQWDRVNWTPSGRRADSVRNLAYYVPLGVMGAHAGLPPASVLIIGVVFSVTNEAAQTFSTSRTPAVSDVITNTAGTLVGVLLVRGIRRLRPVS